MEQPHDTHMRTALVTGSAGFVGYFVCERLLRDGFRVIGLDALTDYYEVSLKRRRQSKLLEHKNFQVIEDYIEKTGLLRDLFSRERPDVVVHCAAQAGVRYSIENPRCYLESNVVGTFELLEAARAYPPQHILLASSSSVFGARSDSGMPYRENDRADHQMSFYAATKKAMESMAHSYAHLFNLPITIFRFFTVYGPWGRPDMALFKFTKAIIEGQPLDVYNYGDMKRDFTYVDDLVEAIRLLIESVPERPIDQDSAPKGYAARQEATSRSLNDLSNGFSGRNVAVDNDHESLSPVAPFRIVNIGNSAPVQLTEFIEAIEEAVGRKAKRNLMPMQAGDVPATWADAELLRSLTGYKPKTSVREGVTHFVKWYRECYSSTTE